MRAVLIETSGNQQYIFGSNKLREAVGASELTHRVGTQWSLEAVRDAGGPDLWQHGLGGLQDGMLDAEVNRPIKAGATVEVIQATSGKALLLTQDEETARSIVRSVTRTALTEAPGLDVFGVISEEFSWDSANIGLVLAEVHELHGRLRRQRPAPLERFQRLPVAADCTTTGWPAAGLVTGPEGTERQSAVAKAKRKAAKHSRERFASLLHDTAHYRFATDVNELEDLVEALSWVAVIHADGNGLGAVFARFGSLVRAADAVDQAARNRAHVDQLRSFSLAVERCSRDAFSEALHQISPGKRGKGDVLPLVPLILGGDDLTVLCPGDAALPFTAAFLQAFERRTAEKLPDPFGDIVPTVMTRAQGDGGGRIGASAGTAVVKPHFPFHQAYDLAEQLSRQAKQVKRTVQDASGPLPCSALDFHILYDQSGPDLVRIRESLLVDGGDTALTMRPYVVTPQELLGDHGRLWREKRHWEDLTKWVAVLVAEDDEGRRQLPNSHVHDLRAALLAGSAEADARLNLLAGRYETLSTFNLAGDGGVSLFHTTISDDDTAQRRTGLLDAVEAAPFLPAPARQEATA